MAIINSVKLSVLAVDNRRIEKVRIEILPEENNEDEIGFKLRKNNNNQ